MNSFSDALYEVYRNPEKGITEGGSAYHVRLVNNGKVCTDDLGKWMGSSVNMSQVKSVLEALNSFMISHLRAGREVHVNGLGFFKMNIQPALRWVKETDETGKTVDVRKRYVLASPEKVRSEYIEFKSISFRPESEIKRRFQGIRFVRSEVKSHSRNLTPEEVDIKLNNYFKVNNFFDRQAFQNLCGYTRTTALRIIRQLLDDKKIENIGRRNSPIYVRGENLIK